MEKSQFETRAISYFNSRHYAFYDQLQNGETLKRLTNIQYAGLLALGGGLLAAGGALTGAGAVLAVGRPSIVDDEVKGELVKIGALCDLIGINLAGGGVNLVLFIYGDDLTDEVIIGKCHLIRDRLNSFKKFSMRIGWSKLPVRATVFFVFENSEKAFHYRQRVQEHCKHFALFYNKLWVLPWGIDLTAKSVWAYSGLPVNWVKPTDIETKLFSER